MSELSVFTPRRFWALLRSDAMSVFREPVLLINLFIALLLPVAIWYWRPEIDHYAAGQFGLSDFARYLLPFALLLPAILIGWVTGMLLLEDRDDGPLMALEVTVIGKGGFLLYRTAIILVLGLLAGLAVLSLLASGSSAVHTFLALLSAFEAVLVCFILVAVAGNKVEGLALSKVINLLALVPLLALIPSPLRFIAGLAPSYWVGEILFRNDMELRALTVLMAVSVHIVWIVVFYRWSTRRIG